MSESTKPTENSAECGNKSKPMLATVFLAPYLPYRVEGIINYTDDDKQIFTLSEKDDINNEVSIYSVITSLYKNQLILRPLSDLTKGIEVNGERFIPMEFLSEKCRLQQKLFGLQNTVDLKVVDYFKLLEWHFDIFGLIDKDLAISIHDVV